MFFDHLGTFVLSGCCGLSVPCHCYQDSDIAGKDEQQGSHITQNKNSNHHNQVIFWHFEIRYANWNSVVNYLKINRFFNIILRINARKTKDLFRFYFTKKSMQIRKNTIRLEPQCFCLAVDWISFRLCWDFHIHIFKKHTMLRIAKFTCLRLTE